MCAAANPSDKKGRTSIADKERTSVADLEEQELVQGSGPDIAVVKFSAEDEEKLGIQKGVHLTIDRPWKTVAKSEMIEILAKMEKFRLVKRLKNYCFEEVLVGYQATVMPTEGHFVCATEKGRDRILGELAQLHSTLSEKVRQYLNRSSLRPAQPYKKVVPVKKERAPIVYEWVGQIEPRLKPIAFKSEPKPCYSRILCRNKEDIVLVESAVQHVQVLATPSVTERTVQTEPEISINDGTQFEPESDLPSFTKMTAEQEVKLANVCREYKETVLEATSYNTLFDLYKDDYSQLLESSEPLNIDKPRKYKHFMSFSDISQFEGRIINALSWHPEIPGAIGVAYGNLSTNQNIKLESDSEDENYRPGGAESEPWTKNMKIKTIRDKNTEERDKWMRAAQRLDKLVSVECNEQEWAASEITLQTIELAMRIRDFQVEAQKAKESSVPFVDTGPEEFDMYYVPYGSQVDVDNRLMKTFISNQVCG